METNNNVTAVTPVNETEILKPEVIRENRIKATKEARERKANAAKVKPENLTFPLMNAKRENIGFINPTEAQNPLSFIGNLIKQYSMKVLFFADFPLNHVVVTIPAAGSYGDKERALIAHKNFLQAITVKLERDEQVKDKKTLSVLALYKAKGWKFTTFTKIGIETVAKEKVKEVSTSVNLVKQITLQCPELKKLVFDNNLRTEIAKEVKDKGIEAGLKLAKEKSYKALPAIQK